MQPPTISGPAVRLLVYWRQSIFPPLPPGILVGEVANCGVHVRGAGEQPGKRTPALSRQQHLKLAIQCSLYCEKYPTIPNHKLEKKWKFVKVVISKNISASSTAEFTLSTRQLPPVLNVLRNATSSGESASVHNEPQAAPSGPQVSV